MGLPFKDTQCGFKAFKREAAQVIFRLQRIERWGFDPEILFIARKLGYTIREVPVTWGHDERSRMSYLRDGMKMLEEMAAIRGNSIAGRYDRDIAALKDTSAMVTRAGEAGEDQPQHYSGGQWKVQGAGAGGAGGVGLDGEDGGEHGALGVGELGAEGRGVEGQLALIGGHLAEVEDDAGHDAAASRGKRVQLLHGIALLLTLGRGEALQGLVAVQHAGALLRVHVVEPGQLVEFVLLELRRQLAKSGLVPQGALLFGEREIAVVVHPLLEMFLVLGRPGAMRGSGRAAVLGGWARWAPWEQAGAAEV